VRSHSHRLLRLVAPIALTAGLFLAACGSADTGSVDGDDRATGSRNLDDNPGTAQSGGTVRFGSYAFPSSLDSVATQVAGSNGGTELAAIYSTLAAYDTDSGEFTRHLAESITAGQDFAEYVITLPPEATFPDGSVLDADAVATDHWRCEAT